MCNRCEEIKSIVQTWKNKQGHDCCWYYPDLFNAIAKILGLESTKSVLPSRAEFELGCKKYQDEAYNTFGEI